MPERMRMRKISAVPSGLIIVATANPALKRRAIVGCPFGTVHAGLGARRERLVDAAFFEGDVFGEAAFDGRFDFAFDQGAGVFDEFFVGEKTVFADPLARD